MPPITDRTWLWLAAACYLAGAALGTLSLLRERKHSRAVMYLILAAGYAFQTFGLYLRGMAVKGCPLGNTFELLQFTSWSAASLYLVVGPAFRLSLLGYGTALLSAGLSLGGLLVPAWDAAKRVHIFGGNAWEWNTVASAWYAQHLYEHWAFTQDLTYLRDIAHPMIKEICQFWEDHLKERADGLLVAPNGKAEAALEDGDLDASPFGACLRRVASKMAFPQFKGDDVGARIVLVLGRAD